METNELHFAKELAIQAGAILLRAFHEPTSVRWKGLDNPVTDADTTANTFLIEAIRKRFPEDGILSEEATDDMDRLNKPRVWIVDPMDGTREFVSHIGEFAVMIGLAIEGKPVMGVVYQPTEAKMFYAESGSGAFLQQHGVTSLLTLTSKPVAREAVAAISRFHDTPEYAFIRKRLGIERIIPSGSAGLKVGLICQGQADLYVHTGPETNQWDTCAPEIILHEAGGRMTDMRNAPLRYNIPEQRNIHGVIASNGLFHEQVIEAARACRSGA